MAKKRRDKNPREVPPTARRLRELYAKGISQLQARTGVSSIDELEMSPEARRLHGVISQGRPPRDRPS